jgi:hypothetical protein
MKSYFGKNKEENFESMNSKQWEFSALRPRFSRVLSHVCEEGDTSEIDVASLSTLTHIATYIRGK